MNRYRWHLLPPAPEGYLAGSEDFSPLMLQLLFHRGIGAPSQLEPFFAADRRLSHDPYLLPDMGRAIARIYRALLSGEDIVVYGDFDADGITGTALLVKGIAALGGRVTPYIPHRLTEGYGLRTTTLEKLSQQGASLVISVDCGITALAEVSRARKLKLDVIITDHHTPLAEIPAAAAVVNPKRTDSVYPFVELSGAGVGIKLLQALYDSLGKAGQADEMMDLAAVGTIADMSPLLGENRYLVTQGLRLLNTCPRPGISQVMARAGLSAGGLDANAVSWTIAPRLNAAGRLAHAMTSYQLLMSESAAEAQEMALWLEQKNEERQRLSAATLDRAREQVLARGIGPLLIAGDSDYPVGIAGLVAGRLCDEFYRPTLVIRTGAQVSSGSCRSIPEFDIIEALKGCQRLLAHFGGHSQAAGFTLPTRNLGQFTKHLTSLAAAQLAGLDLRPQLDIDAESQLRGLNGNTLAQIQRLAPFGRGNPAPTLLSRGVQVVDCRSMGGKGEHLRFRLRQGDSTWDGVAFRMGAHRNQMPSHLNIVYNLEMNRWAGQDSLRLNIIDLAPAG